MPAGVLKSDTARYGIIGAVLGASAPVLHTLFQLVVFHSDISVSSYLRYAILESPEDLASNIFIGGAAFVMAGAGAVVGRMRENDKRQQARIESSNRELAALNSIAEIISRTRELDAILFLVLKETLSLSFLRIERKGAIFVRDEADPETLVMSASIDLAHYLTHHEKRIPVGYCLCGKAVQTGEVITSSDCFEDADHTTNYPGMTGHGHIVIPIMGSGGVSGVMTFYTPANAVPSREDIRILSAIASQLAVAIDNVRLQKTVMEAKADAHRKDTEIFKNVEALKGLIEVDRIILSTMDRDEMLFRVATQLRQIVPADAGCVALKEDETGYYRFIGGWGLDARKGEVCLTKASPLYAELKSGKPVCRPDVLDDVAVERVDRLLLGADVKANVFVPIMRKGLAAGFLVMGSARADGLSKENIATAVNFASRMGIALEHSRLIHNLEEMSVNIIHALATAIDAKSPWTKGHSERVAHYSMYIAEKMGLDGQLVERLRLAGLLHDIGKIGTYDMLLDKTGKLTDEEVELIKQHPDRGCEILSPIKEFRDILPAVRHHHERWDGLGYPSGLKGEEIPLDARILCVADSFDTMTANRPYRPAIGLENAVQELLYCSGTQFCPEVVAIFLEILKEGGPRLAKINSGAVMPVGRLFPVQQDYHV